MPAEYHSPAEYDSALGRAVHHATRWLESLPARPVPPRASVAEVVAALDAGFQAGLPQEPMAAGEVIDLLAAACEPGLAVPYAIAE